ncbi:hypothetical protein NDU88_007888 [Pleurodeles waltl]|uniref:Endonuclease/exonuclease/phosphatase domain-containing protein n=1 Tax=Pleurodeles waltl TaxID=8319 RepID=A0AAV7U1Q7_PLEWA|nr:hypothetical protein NDU88_007888 [Pleurodeles waltl]
MCFQETWLCDDPEPVDGFMGLSRGATQLGSGRASGGLITLASTRIANKFIEIKTKCRWLLAGQVDLYNVIGGAKQLLILNVYIQPGNVFDYNIQCGLFEEDLELLCTGNAGCLTLMLGDFNHKLDPNGSDNLYKELLAAAEIPRSIFPNVECSARDLSLARTLGSLGMFCLNGRMKNDRPAKKTFRTGNQECPIDYAFVNTWFFGKVQNFEVGDTEGSDHWPLQIIIHSVDKIKKERDKALIVLIEYPRRATTRLTDSSLKALNNLIINYPILNMEEDPNDIFKGYNKSIALMVIYLKSKLKIPQEGKRKEEPYMMNNSKIWFNQECRCRKQRIRRLLRDYEKRPSVVKEEKLRQAKQDYKKLIRQRKREYVNKNCDVMMEVIKTQNIRGFW